MPFAGGASAAVLLVVLGCTALLSIASGGGDGADKIASVACLAASLIAGLESVDDTARRGMLAEVDDRTSEVTEYILQQQETYGDDLPDVLVDVSGDAAVDIIRSLRLMSMTILADEHGGSEPFAVLEYALDDSSTDDVLLVNLGSDGSVQSVMSAD